MMTIATTTTRRYYPPRANKYNRSKDDIRRQILNCLNHLGPCPITEILYRIALSHGQGTIYLNELIASGLITRKPLETLLKELTKTQLGRLIHFSENVTDVYIITKKGQKYLNKLNEMELMMTWGR